jgi:ATP-dependent helicase/nuclease subunit B
VKASNPSMAGRAMAGRGRGGGRGRGDEGPLLPFEDPGGAAPAPATERRVFLGWDSAPLARAAEWLLRERGLDLGTIVVALPTARAARRMRELLARAAPPSWVPPRLLTQGELVDELLTLEQRPASRLVRTLAWAEALARLDDERRARLTPAHPSTGSPAGSDSPRALLRLAETVRTLHGELAPEERDFAQLAAGPRRVDLDEEAERWEALAVAQRTYREILKRIAREDPHEGRSRSIAAGRIDRSREVVLVGVADMNRLLARALAALPRVTALVAAPRDLAEGFDALGSLVPTFWHERDVELPLERWKVAEKPVDQAEAVRDVLRAQGGRFAPDEVVLALADDDVAPYLERMLEEAGATPRRAAGTPVEHTRPVRLLRALARYLARGGFDELAALLRDPDLGPALGRGDDPAEWLDAYHGFHLPQGGRADWVARPHRDNPLPKVQERLDRELGPLSEGGERPAAAWAAPLRSWLARVYSTPLDTDGENDRRLAEALQLVGRALGELEEVPEELGAVLPADEAIELVLRTLRGQHVPPPPVAPGVAPVELLGWLDLPLDDAPAAIVTGFNEGTLPQALAGHAFLPDAERRRLGIVSDAERLARDAYATSLVLASRPEAVFVSARRSAEGDPRVPSRLAFRRPATEIPTRVRHFLPADERRPVQIEEVPPALRPPRVPSEPPRALSVSSFRAYLSSPYQFWLERVLRLGTLDDRTRELDPLGFGTLVHAVLEHFGRHGPVASTDPEEIGAFLTRTVEDQASARFGSRPLPAVELQREQIGHRLRLFAYRQAARVEQGWRIHEVEWQPETPVTLVVDGEPLELRGRIDRVDVHADGRWAVLDYKSGERFQSPLAAHRSRNGDWKDLQLPLYRELARPLGLSGEPELGYAWIGKDETEIGFFVEPWSSDDLAQALDVAHDVGRRVRAGDFDELGRPPWDEIPRAIRGAGTLVLEDEGDDA